MVPSALVVIDLLPLTPNGKIDYKALAEVERAALDLSQEFVAPRTEDEKVLAEIWRDVLDLDRVGIHDDFFDLGGHSILGILLFARVEERFGQRLPISILFKAPTIAQLAVELEKTNEGEERNLLVPLQSEGSKSPFFCVHGFGGSVLGYKELAEQLGKEQPFYGLEARGLDGNTELDESIEAMASRNINTMRIVQPHGPYRIGGYCLGGVVAFEMARQLEEQGESVALVGIMEGFAPVRSHKDLPLLHPRRLLAVWKSIPFWFQDYSQFSLDQFIKNIRVRLNKTRNRIFRRTSEDAVASIINTDLELLAPHQRRMMINHMQALRQYSGGAYKGRVSLFRVKHQTFNRTVFGDLDLDYGWGRLARGGVDVRFVDGAHRNINLMPYVPSLASELTDCLESVNPVEE
jgi:thioesterase domain-containing protein